MSLQSDLYTYLRGLTTITDQVAARIYPHNAPTSAAFPYITYARISSTHEHHMTAAAGLSSQVIQFDVFASTIAEAEAAADALRAAMDGFQGGTMGSTAVRHIELTNERDTFLPPADDSEVGVYNISVDFSIWAAESVPTFPAP